MWQMLVITAEAGNYCNLKDNLNILKILESTRIVAQNGSAAGGLGVRKGLVLYYNSESIARQTGMPQENIPLHFLCEVFSALLFTQTVATSSLRVLGCRLLVLNWHPHDGDVRASPWPQISLFFKVAIPFGITEHVISSSNIVNSLR